MTEKRFKLDDGIIWENTNSDSWFEIFPSKAVELLNALHEENQELKARKYPIPIEEMDKYLNYRDIIDLQRANEIIESQRKEIRKLHEENQLLQKKNKTLKNRFERKDRQLQRAKKDTRKYTDYFMNELNWDCERIIEEVFK